MATIHQICKILESLNVVLLMQKNDMIITCSTWFVMEYAKEQTYMYISQMAVSVAWPLKPTVQMK